MQLVLIDFERAKSYLKQQIDKQKQLLEEAALKYINRESREDDMITIKDLQQQIRERNVRERELMVIDLILITSRMS